MKQLNAIRVIICAIKHSQITNVHFQKLNLISKSKLEMRPTFPNLSLDKFEGACVNVYYCTATTRMKRTSYCGIFNQVGELQAGLMRFTASRRRNIRSLKFIHFFKSHSTLPVLFNDFLMFAKKLFFLPNFQTIVLFQLFHFFHFLHLFIKVHCTKHFFLIF